MFNVFASGSRKRRIWTPGTIAASIAAHVLVLGGAAYATLHASPPETVEVVQDLGPLPPPPPKPVDVQPAPATPDQPPPRPGQTVELPAPVQVPTDIPPVKPDETPLHAGEVTGEGTLGNTFDPNATTQAPGSATTPSDGASGGPELVTGDELGAMPELTNRSEVQRMLQRSYPSGLRDQGIAGEARLQFIINTDGTVDMASVQVVSATRDEFGDAAKRAVERFHFKPATMMDEPVRVLITMPIRFTISPNS
jgi:protein TonB